MYVLQIIVFVPTGLNLCIKLPECAELVITASALIYVCVGAYKHTCALLCLRVDSICTWLCMLLRLCVRPAAARVTLVNFKAVLCSAELTNLSHPSPRAAFETDTDGLGSALSIMLSLAHPALPCIKLYSSQISAH